MQSGLGHHNLVYYIQIQGKQALESRQLAKRLQELLPIRLKEIRNDLRNGRKIGVAERHALVDQRFLDYITEMIEVSGHSMESKVQFETHRMLIKARQSLRGLRFRTH